MYPQGDWSEKAKNDYHQHWSQPSPALISLSQTQLINDSDIVLMKSLGKDEL